jgi:protein-S-isoprenylcysteine O-methyltransferase Ste14
MVKLAVFILTTIAIVLYSWPSLRNRRTHGFYRFFAFETILVLILSNVDHWYANPLSANQIVSWVVLVCSLVLAVHGFWLLRIIGRPQGNFENTTKLVTVGAYKYIRHPLYSSLLLLAWGTFFKDLSLLGLLLTLNATLFLFATARVEESENLARFGEEYATYMQSTRMFIPFLF